MRTTTNYRYRSLRDRVYTLNSVDDIRKFAQILNDAIGKGELVMSPSSLRKLNAAVQGRKRVIETAVLYGPDGRPIPREE